MNKRKGPPNRLSPVDGFLLFWELRLPVRLFYVFPYVSYHLFWISQHFPLCPSVWMFSTNMFNPWSSLLLTLIYPSSHLLIFFGGGRGLRHEAWESFVPPPKIEPMPPAVEVQSLNCWTARRFYIFQFYNVCLILLKINFNFLMKLSMFSSVSSIFSSVFLNISNVTIVKSSSADSSA